MTVAIIIICLLAGLLVGAEQSRRFWRRIAETAEASASADREVAKAIESRANATARRIIDLETANALLQAKVHRLVRRNRNVEEECADLRAEIDSAPEVHPIATYPLPTPLRPPV